MRYEYFTESLSIRVDTAGRKGATQLRDVEDQTVGIRNRLNELATEGWEFMQIGDIPVTGQTLKGGAYRVIAIAVFRRQLSDWIHPSGAALGELLWTCSKGTVDLASVPSTFRACGERIDE